MLGWKGSGRPIALSKEITCVVILKLAALFLLWYLFFSHPIKPHLQPHMIMQLFTT